MTKHEYLEALQAGLKQRGVADVEEIVQEYTQHFAFKLQDGYGEEEIAARLGDPGQIAAQYDTAQAPADRRWGLKVTAGAGLAVIDMVSFSFLLMLYAFCAVLAGLSAASLTVAVSYIGGLNPYGLLPPMPYGCALLASVTLLALAVLAGLGLYFWAMLVSRLLKSYLRYRKNFMAAVSGTAKLPPYPVRLQLPPKTWRVLRRLTLLALCVFGFGFVLNYIVCAVSTGTLGWWHAWNWFV